MVKPSFPEEALLFVGALFRQEDYLSLVREKVAEMLGATLFESPPVPWDYSSYYEEEMGRPLKKVFIFFGERIDPMSLAGIKVATNGIEKELSREGKRNINLDPGYLTPAKIVLASTKNYSHRIYIGQGIFAEVTLVYRDGGYRPHLFTYRDYASGAYAEIFGRAREVLQKM
jgi:hypothetical protein